MHPCLSCLAEKELKEHTGQPDSAMFRGLTDGGGREG